MRQPTVQQSRLRALILRSGGNPDRGTRKWWQVKYGDSCWSWRGSIDTTSGYGKWRGDTAHRAVYKYLIGPIPRGLQLDHLCLNKSCVNPAHLEPVTPGENLRRACAHKAATGSGNRSSVVERCVT